MPSIFKVQKRIKAVRYLHPPGKVLPVLDAAEPCQDASACPQSCPGLGWGSRGAAGGQGGSRKRQPGQDPVGLEGSPASMHRAAAADTDTHHDLLCQPAEHDMCQAVMILQPQPAACSRLSNCNSSLTLMLLKDGKVTSSMTQEPDLRLCVGMHNRYCCQQ